ncbi:hypothetical protein NEOLEDRAFT_1166133 [Neolentinus lepideus HHB14362 ss-1]|uniref:F-box domain-containing protein n=1 Tax=Neolentinus lepideus HHB14362 ss-1 TaxID=1314782 RepID=A0A165W6X1_9AGAM|nr:hypothetical protein NEOLEDRAFT_1166133 [Neolentinus lepideus HHB14362 ss-1]
MFCAEWPSRPFLRLYEKEEAEALQYQEEDSRVDDVWKLQRFLGVIKGFHTGSLDLTGRHEWRYKRYRERWDRFLLDFSAAALHTREEIEEIDVPWSRRTNGKIRVTHYLIPPEDLDAFYKNWELPEWYWIYPATVDTLETIAANPNPKFQQLLLTHLPTELLDHIFFLAPQSKAFLLGSTCRLLREISSRYIYKSRGIALAYKPDLNKRIGEEDLREMVYAAKTRLLDTVKELLARRDIMQKTTYLHLSDEWQMFNRVGDDVEITRPNEDNLYGCDINKDFYEPILTNMATFISTSVNLTRLSLVYIFVSPAIVRAIVSLPRLHTLSMVGCNFSPGLRLFPVRMPSSQSILDLQIKSPTVLWANYVYWTFLTMCPNVRSLSAVGGYTTETEFEVLPDLELRTMFNPWSTVERFVIERIRRYDALVLSLWIGEANAMAPLRLTHFKVDSHWPMNREEAFSLILALEGAPLRVLALCGLRYARLDLIERIAELFPDLEGLTLIHRRRHVNDTNSMLSVWPHASWEYAPLFRQFNKLEHIGMNLYTQTITDYVDCELMQRMETGEWDENGQDEVYMSEELDRDTVVRLFALHCPTLKSFTFHDRASLRLAYLISRRSDGTPVVQPEERHSSILGPILKRYCPSAMYNQTWDPALPET